MAAEFDQCWTWKRLERLPGSLQALEADESTVSMVHGGQPRVRAGADDQGRQAADETRMGEVENSLAKGPETRRSPINMLS